MFASAHEAVAAGRVAALDAIDFEGNHFAIEGAENGLQGPDPAQGARAPAHGFGPGEFADGLGHELGNDIDCSAAGLAHRRDVKFALLVVLRREVFELEAGGFQEAVDGGLGRIDAGAFALLGYVSGLGVQALDGEYQAAGAGMGLGSFIGEARFHQAIGDQCAQVFRRLRLHAGGDFFGEQFDQQFGHQALRVERT